MDVQKLYASGEGIDVFAYYGPGDGKYADGTPMGKGTDFRTKERYIEYKECGFDILLLEDEADYRGEDWQTSKVKEIMDICFEIGLKAIVLDRRIHSLAVNGFENKEIDGFKVVDAESLTALIKFYMKDYSTHPAFYGVYVMDEPASYLLDRVSSIIGAIKKAKPDCYVHLCYTSAGALYPKNPEFIKRDGWTELVADIYPLVYLEEPENARIARGFTLNMEKIRKLCDRFGLKFVAVSLQAFGGSFNGVTGYGWREVDEVDLRYTTNISLAFFPDKLVWYHYWASKFGAKDRKNKNIMSVNGEKIFYDQVKALNAEIKTLTKVTKNFKYKGINYFRDAHTVNKFFMNEQDYVFNGMKVENVTGELVITEGFDEKNGLYGFTVFNAVEPTKRKKSGVTLKFENTDKIVIYNCGVPSEKKLQDGKLVLNLDCAEGRFIIPCPRD